MRKACLEQAFRNNIIPVGINAEWVEKRTKKGKELTQKYRNRSKAKGRTFQAQQVRSAWRKAEFDMSKVVAESS